MSESKIPDPNAETALLDLFDAIFPSATTKIERTEEGPCIVTTYSSNPLEKSDNHQSLDQEAR